VGSAVLVATVLILKGYLPRTAPAALRLALQVAAGATVYAGILLIFYRQRVFRYFQFLRQFWRDRSRDGAAPSPAASAGI